MSEILHHFPIVHALDVVLNERVRGSVDERELTHWLRTKHCIKRRLSLVPDALVDAEAAEEIERLQEST